MFICFFDIVLSILGFMQNNEFMSLVAEQSGEKNLPSDMLYLPSFY
jgi:hypothetical protein